MPNHNEFQMWVRSEYSFTLDDYITLLHQQSNRVTVSYNNEAFAKDDVAFGNLTVKFQAGSVEPMTP